ELRIAARDSSNGVRVYAAMALLQIDPQTPGLVAPLIETLKDEDNSLRREALHLLEGIVPRTTEAVPALMELLRDVKIVDVKSCSMRVQTCNVLARIGTAAVPALKAALKDKSREVRMLATSALFQMGREAKGAVPELVEAMKDFKDENN